VIRIKSCVKYDKKQYLIETVKQKVAEMFRKGQRKIGIAKSVW